MADDNEHDPSVEQHWREPSREEKRQGERRKGNDRREMIRFEPDKEDRRSGLDRRGGKVKDKWGTDKPI